MESMKFNIVVSLNNHNLIGENDDLLIHSKKDLRNFQKITTEGNHKNIVIMGYNTWLSIPESKRPLKDRYNIILSRNHSVEEDENTKLFRGLSEAFDYTKELKGELFVIGGSQIFNEISKRINNIDVKEVRVVIEQVSAMPGQGVTSMFNFGQTFGILKGICSAMQLSMYFVRPAKWKKYFNLINSEKDASRTRVIEIFPYISSQLSKKKDSNKADAILIASFYHETYKIEE